MSGSYDPNSYDAMISQLMTRLDQQDRVSMAYRHETLDILEKIQKDVGSLKSWRDVITARTAIISLMVAGGWAVGTWIWEHFLSK